MPANPLPAQLAGFAQSCVDTLVSTSYQHNQVIENDEGIFDCDCSEFVGFILQTLAPRHFAPIPTEQGHVSPRAVEFYLFLAALPLDSTSTWTRIARLADAHRGDVLAWRFPTIQVGHDTGHVVFLAETPKLQPDGTFSVRVYDSAAQPHFEDTRGSGDDQFPTGVGSGFLHFQVASDGSPIAFCFAPGDHFVTLPIAIGRTEPLPHST